MNPSLKNEVFAVRGEPDHIRSDNGPEFANKAVKRCLAISGVETLFIASGSPWEKGYFPGLKIWQNQNEYLLLLT